MSRPGERIAWAFRAATARQPKPAELALLTAGYERHVWPGPFRAQPKAAEQLLGQGKALGWCAWPSELAAMTTVANVLLNPDELINK